MTAIILTPVIRMLYTIATEDESVLKYPLPDGIFGFHAQQSCEKLLKALLSVHECRAPRTHDLIVLVKKLEDECSEVLPPHSYDLAQLVPFGVRNRYESPAELTEVDRAAIRETVAALRTHTLNSILALQRP